MSKRNCTAANMHRWVSEDLDLERTLPSESFLSLRYYPGPDFLQPMHQGHPTLKCIGYLGSFESVGS